MTIQPGATVTFDLKGNKIQGAVTLIEGKKATVMYADHGLDSYITLNINDLNKP